MTKKSVLLIGEHTLMLAFLKAWLSRFRELRVLAETSNAREALALVVKLRPAVVLMDFDTLQAASLGVLATLRASHPKVKVIIYFAHTHDNVAVSVIRAGAAGFVLKSSSSAEMEGAIRTVLKGGVYLSPAFLKSVGTVQGIADAKGKALSSRQAQVLKLVALGLSTKAIAFELKISGKTVDVHKQALVGRLGLKDSSELFKYSVEVRTS